MSYVLPAGTYVIGDPCYNLSPARFDELMQTSDAYEREGTVTLDDGSTVTVYALRTKNGDGRYNDLSGFEYAVDSAAIGIMPIEALQGETPDEATKVVKFKSEFEVYDSAGTLIFGRIEINTDPVEEDEDDDFEPDLHFGDLDHDF